MKKFASLLFVLGLAAAPLAVDAATCTQGDITVTGDTCGIVDGQCTCTDRPKH